jgi:F-type H+-transporting ATPase subunit epsilon
LTLKFVTKETLDPVRVRLELKEVDEELDRFSGDPTSNDYAELVRRELWAATQLELYGDPPPPRVRPLELALGSDSYKAPGDEASAEEAPPAN